MTRRRDIDDLAGEIVDVLPQHPQKGISNDQLIQKLDCSKRQFDRAIHRARQILEDDKINIVCHPNGLRRPWLYVLIQGEKIVNPEHSIWMYSRLGDLHTRERTISAVAQTAVNDTDGRTKTGKCARLIANHLKHGIEQQELIQGLLEFDHAH